MILIGLVIGLIVLGIFGGLSVLGANNSANLASATGILSQTLTIVGIGVFIGIITTALRFRS